LKVLVESAPAASGPIPETPFNPVAQTFGMLPVQRHREPLLTPRENPVPPKTGETVDRSVVQPAGLSLLAETHIDRFGSYVQAADERSFADVARIDRNPEVAPRSASSLSEVVASHSGGTVADPLVAPLQPSVEIPVAVFAQPVASFARPLLRHTETDQRAIDRTHDTVESMPATELATLKTQPETMHAVVATGVPAATNQNDRVLLRQYSSPVEPWRASATGATAGVHRVAQSPSGRWVDGHLSSVRSPSIPQFRGSLLTHRASRLVDTLHASPDIGSSGSFSPPLGGGGHDSLAGGTNSTGFQLPDSSAAKNQPGRASQGLNVDVTQLANRVYDLLVRRLASERQRRGL
jgi:hypothetical protein